MLCRGAPAALGAVGAEADRDAMDLIQEALETAAAVRPASSGGGGRSDREDLFD